LATSMTLAEVVCGRGAVILKLLPLPRMTGEEPERV